MSFTVTITANSLEELADKALALGGKLAGFGTGLAATPAEALFMPPLAVAPEPVVFEPAVVAAPAPEPAAPEPEPAAPALDYATDVRPLVLAAVKAKSKPVVEAILQGLGSETARELPPAKWPELIAKLNAVLAK
jgi:hypothetical protein